MVIVTFPMWTIGDESIWEAVWYIHAVGSVLEIIEIIENIDYLHFKMKCRQGQNGPRLLLI